MLSCALAIFMINCGVKRHETKCQKPKALKSGFCCMKRLGLFLLPPGWDASWRVTPRRVNPSIKFAGTHLYIHLGGERHCESKVSGSRIQHGVARSGLEPGPLDPESSALTTTPPCLHSTFSAKITSILIVSVV